MAPTRKAVMVGLRHQSLPDAIVAELRDLIVDGVLSPGQRLVERDLAGQLEVSRIPLREAVLQLEAEGLVQRLPRRGTVVATLTHAGVADLFDVRESLEGLAAGLAAERADPAALAALGRHLKQADMATKRGHTSTIAKLNVAFHEEIVAAACNTLLSTMMAPLHSRMRWLFRLLTANGGDPNGLCQEHSAIYEAIAAGTRDRAERLASEHVAKTRNPTLALFTTPEYGAESKEPAIGAQEPRTGAAE